MAKRKNTNRDTLAAVRAASRDAAIGKGQPGTYNPNRTVRFATPSDKRAARGRTWRGED